MQLFPDGGGLHALATHLRFLNGIADTLLLIFCNKTLLHQARLQMPGLRIQCWSKDAALLDTILSLGKESKDHHYPEHWLACHRLTIATNLFRQTKLDIIFQSPLQSTISKAFVRCSKVVTL